VLAVAAGLVAVGLLASGCVRVHAALAVSSSDQVSGDIVIGALPTAQNSQGPQLAVPPGMAGRVTLKPYSANGYVGDDVTFHDLSFQEMTAFAAAISSQSNSYHITFQRSGDLVTMDGSANLADLPTTGVDVRFKVAFPGPVTSSNGAISGQTVSWTMQAGQVTPFRATDQYTLGNSRGWRFWALALGGGLALVSAFLVLLALWARRRNLKKERAYLAASGY
jgi:hypothetical protein